MLKALITGISGFVGSRLARMLLDRRWEVAGIIRRQSSSRAYIRLMPIMDEIELYKTDILDPVGVYNALRESNPDVIFHLAAQSHVHHSFKCPRETFEVNLLGTLNLLENIRILDIDPKVIFAGTSEEYGKQEKLPINEENPLNPQSPYAVSKVAADLLCQNYANAYGMRIVISRAFNHEGAGRGDNFVTSSIVRQCIDYDRNILDAIRLGNVNTFRDWSHVEDIAEGYILLAEKGKSGEVYVLGSERTNSVMTYLLWTLEEIGFNIKKITTADGRHMFYDPAEEVERVLFGKKMTLSKMDEWLLSGYTFLPEYKRVVIHTDNYKIPLILDKKLFRPADVPILLSDTTKAKSLGFKVRHSLRDIIREQIAHYSGVKR